MYGRHLMIPPQCTCLLVDAGGEVVLDVSLISSYNSFILFEKSAKVSLNCPSMPRMIEF